MEPIGVTGRVLIIEDQASVRRFLGEYLRQNGFEVLESWSLEGAYRVSRLRPPDLVVLDLVLEDEDGLDFLRERPFDAPVVIVSSKSAGLDRVKALELGADDFLVKPVEPRELVIKLKRLQKIRVSESGRSRSEALADLNLDVIERVMSGPSGKRVKLTRSELLLLRLFVENAGAILEKHEISRKALGHGFDEGSRAVDVMVSKLRQKLNDAGSRLSILSVRSMGYRADMTKESSA